MKATATSAERLAGGVSLFSRRVRFPGRYHLLRLIFPPERFRSEGSTDRWFDRYDGDLRILCNPGSFIEWNVLFRGYYDPDLSSALKHLVGPGAVVFDVGANVGAYTLLMAKRLRGRGRIVAFEPNPEVFARLIGNVNANNLQQLVEACQLGLSSGSGPAIMHGPRSDHPHRGIASLHQYSEVLTHSFEITLSTLDHEVERRQLERLDVIKIDTEGNDVHVLEGARGSLERFRPAIVFEANASAHAEAQSSLVSVRQLLTGLGYAFRSIGFGGRLRGLADATSFPDTNIVCLPPSR